MSVMTVANVDLSSVGMDGVTPPPPAPSKLFMASLSGHRRPFTPRLLFLAWRFVDESVDDLACPALGSE